MIQGPSPKGQGPCSIRLQFMENIQTRFLDMKLFKFSVAALLALATAFLGGCSDDDGIDNRDRDYGYVQFKLHKEASYDAVSRAQKPQLDYLSEASKVQVSLYYDGTTITQSLTLSAPDKESAEFGLRSEKLRLLAGQYQIITFSLFNADDELIYNGMPGEERLDIVEPRGTVRFSISKDLSDFTETPVVTRAAERQYTFDEIAFLDLTVRHKTTNELTTFEKLPAKFSIHFRDDREDGAPEDIEDGYQTSSLECDTLLSLKAGDYSLERYQAYDKNKILLETNKRPKNLDFTIEDNKTTEAKVGVTLYEADEYIRDYYALYEIWKALDGEHWSYRGENYPTGVNWDFNKDPDLWGVQPGVEVHSNGRVAKISIGEFGFRGHVPAAIGQLSELVELYLGTHNDGNLLEYDPSLAHDKSLSERNRTRMERHKEFLSLIHIPTQTSEPIARALAEHGISIPATSLYKNFTEDQIIDRKTGLQNNIRPYDVVHGKLTNGLKSIDPAIGKLEKLEYLNIANGELEEIPAEVANLKSLTDLEVYNCPKMTRFPVEIAQMPELVSVNISNNAQWSAEELYKGLDAIANGPSKEKLQILYATNNKLREIPESFSNLKKISLLDLSKNQIETLHPLGKEVAPMQLYLDHNNITSLPANSDGRHGDLLGDLQQAQESSQHLLCQVQVRHEIGGFLLQRDRRLRRRRGGQIQGPAGRDALPGGKPRADEVPQMPRHDQFAGFLHHPARLQHRRNPRRQLQRQELDGAHIARPDLQQTEDPVQGFHGRAAALPLRAGYFVQLVRQVPVRAAQLRRADRIRHPRPARCRG